MRDGQARPQRRTMATVEIEERIGSAVSQTRFHAPLEIFAGPAGVQALALQAEVGDFIERIEHP
jgi:hypothetical protein